MIYPKDVSFYLILQELEHLPFYRKKCIRLGDGPGTIRMDQNLPSTARAPKTMEMPDSDESVRLLLQLIKTKKKSRRENEKLEPT